MFNLFKYVVVVSNIYGKTNTLFTYTSIISIKINFEFISFLDQIHSQIICLTVTVIYLYI